MTVYIVEEFEGYDCPRIVGVFTTETLAQACLDERPKEEVLPPIPEWEIDDECRIAIHQRIRQFTLDRVST